MLKERIHHVRDPIERGIGFEPIGFHWKDLAQKRK
jgi:hypothetical protein